MSETYLEVRNLGLGRRGGRGYQPDGSRRGDLGDQHAQQSGKRRRYPAANLGGPLDPLITPEDKKRREYFSSKAIIDACRPFPWRNEFPEVCESSPALKEQTLSKWRKSLEHDK